MCVLFQALCIWPLFVIQFGILEVFEGFESKNTSQALLPAFEF